ncbi:hypothetical protein GUJ93_ZPchr0007g4440 [Zizania palustris]|uniref:Rad60/SUMO-like domain-containing protein n=1 Tax=Zizania palustris TaxID=103762 RepID=A0A8J5TE37_ZIZPA|nr:hypothetical protein GUJ93_ZPchr0007g4440 [Zizania palustris]
MQAPAPAPEEDSKAGVKSPEFITIKVVDQEERRPVRHTIRTTDKLQVVMDRYYSEAPEVTYGTGSFYFDDIRLKGDKTPAQLKMEDGDIIDYFAPQIGG